jgi:hypothetical protein
MEGKQPTHSEEIDLFFIFRPIGKLLMQAGVSIAYYFSVLRANLLLFFAIIIILSGMGFCLRFIIPGSYKTQGIFASRLLPASYCDILTDDLNNHTGEPVVAGLLHISPEAADHIRKIEMVPVKELLDSKDSALHGFSLILILKKMDSLAVIQRGLVGYYENNEYSLNRKEERRSSLLELRLDISAKIGSLDSLSRIVNSSIIPRSAGQGIILGQPIDPVNVYKAQAGYYKEKVTIDSTLANMDDIETVQPFLPLSVPNSPRFNRLFLISFLVALAIALIMTPVWGKKPRVRAYSVPAT